MRADSISLAYFRGWARHGFSIGQVAGSEVKTPAKHRQWALLR
jgi:hypothetical protein